MNLKKIKQIFIDDNFNLYAEFADGEMRYVNLKTWINGKSRIKQDLGFCKKAFIEHGSIISWPTGISIDPEIIYDKGKKIDIFPEIEKPTKKKTKEKNFLLREVIFKK